METFVVRLQSDDDVTNVLEGLCQTQAIDAGCIVSAVGSLKQASIRFADQPKATVLNGPWEIVSISGRLSRHGCHLHLAVADKTGRTIGGHLMPGSRVYTTLELVIGRLPDLTFRRQPDGTGIYQRRIEDTKTPG